MAPPAYFRQKLDFCRFSPGPFNCEESNSRRNCISVFYQNVRGLRSKVNSFNLSVKCCDFDLIVLTETWLVPSVLDTELFGNDFAVYRVDRSSLNSVNSRGGGVLIAVRSSFSSERISVPNTEMNEMVFVRFRSNSRCYYVCSLYIPPGAGSSVYATYADSLRRFLECIGQDDEILILGDFNFRSVNWIADVDNPFVLLPIDVSSGDANLLDSLSSYGLFQLNNIFNEHRRLLDLFFCSRVDDVSLIASEVPLVPVDLHHPPIEVYIDELSDGTPSAPEMLTDRSYDFKRADYVNLRGYLQGIDWSFLLNEELSVDEVVNQFYDKLLIGIHLFVPQSRRRKSCHPVWYNRSILRLKNLKTKKFRIWTRSRRMADYRVYRHALKTLRQAKNAAQFLYLRRMQGQLKSDPKSFWSFVNSSRKSVSVPSTISYNNVTSTSPSDVCNVFADFFESVYSPVLPPSSHLSSFPEVSEYVGIGLLHLTCEEVLDFLLKLNTRKGKGPDSIPPMLLKTCAFELCYPLCCLFNKSLYSGVFPEKWKLSHIIPIFKNGTRNLATNYRGVAIIPTIGKLFEKIVCSLLISHFKSYITLRQHGFMKGRSTVTNLMEFTQAGLDTIESGLQLDVIYTDFLKAFDRVDHSILVRKLERIGVHSSMLGWIRSYLTGRRQFVLVVGERSRIFPVLSGVPQGSHLGPLLFVLFINDIADIFIHSKCLIYADDLKIFCKVDSIHNAIGIQRDLDSLSSWCQRNRLFLNISKCKVISFHRKLNPVCFQYSIDGVYLARVRQISDLGVLFDERIDFSAHIDSIISKAYSRLGFMKRICARFDDPYCLRNVYYSLVRSILEYASPIWNPGYAVHSDRIESIQKKFLLYALRRLPWRRDSFELPSYESRCRLIQLESLHQRRVNASLFFLFDLLVGHIDTPDLLYVFGINVPSRSLRETNFFHINYHRTNYGLSSPVSSLSLIFNEHSQFFDFTISRDSFRRNIRSINRP